MKKNITLFVALFFLCGASIGQKTVITYYDFQHTEKHEVYYTNDYGVKTGSYTEYSKYGGILVKGTYKDDKKEGEWVVNDSKGHLVSKETYLDDVLDGPASYYDYDVLGSVSGATGTYKDGKRTGIWNCIAPFFGGEGAIYPSDMNLRYGYTDDKWKQAVGRELGVKYLAYYDAKEPKKEVWTFYPSSRVESVKINANGNLTEEYTCYPNGKLYNLYIADSTGVVIFRKEWYFPDGGSMDSIPYYISKVKDTKFQQAVLSDLGISNYGNSQKDISETPNERSAKVSSTPNEGTAIVSSDKAYYYREADTSTIRKAYNVKGDKLKCGQVSGDFIYVTYTSAKGIIVQGWMLKSDLTIEQ